ncbi:dTDP-4-dehydrorhamnose reductase [Desulfitibacter alkalitolerans]|uniref:dTDP-4-dehydrorhamnose reductase n=1 Tax=Desulfitibacter alkalitolerans TaxID=264641 RepID=UPI0004848D1B|nr:dTDP-4-dehydrorhamnose reductase [Desulfitibacter alkalitolerans]
MRILLLGKNGQIGWELQRTMATLGEITAWDIEDLDLTDEKAIRTGVRKVQPQLIVNAAAYTAVDKAEEEPELAMAINGIAPGILAEEAKKIGAGIIHYSTDYVFDGTKNSPYTEEDEPNPINVYGKTKLEGERNIQNSGAPYFIFRTSWAYGIRGKNFFLKILDLIKDKEFFNVVDDQIGSPTWSRMIAEATAQIVLQCNQGLLNSFDKHKGIYNMTADGYTSWYGFANIIVKKYCLIHSNRFVKINHIKSEDYPSNVARPKNSILSNTKLFNVFGISLPHWEKQLELVFAELIITNKIVK